MAGTAEFSAASSAGVNCKAAAPVFSSICAIRDDEIRIHGPLRCVLKARLIEPIQRR